jgi:haloalkane dehalogenase
MQNPIHKDTTVQTHHTDFSRAFESPHRMLDLPGGRMASYRFGEGPPIVAVHGWPLHAATWRMLLPWLTPHFTVHLIDLPGTGHTQWNRRAGMSTNVTAIHEAITALDLPRYALLAHNSGGAFARHVAADNPRVAALVMSGTEIPKHHPWQLSMYLMAAKVPAGDRLLGRLMQVGMIRRSALGLGGCFTDPSYGDGAFNDLFVRPLVRPDVMRRQGQLLRDFDLRAIDALADVHARIRAPTLCVWGDRDPFFPIEKARAMLPQFAGEATLVAVSGGRLFVHEDHAETYASHVVSFLKRHHPS